MSKKTSGRVGNLLAAFEQKKEEPTNQPVTKSTTQVKWPPASSTATPSTTTQSTTTTPPNTQQSVPVKKSAPVTTSSPPPQKVEQTPVKNDAEPPKIVQQPATVEVPKTVQAEPPKSEPKKVEQAPVKSSAVEQKPQQQQQAKSGDEEIDEAALLALIERLEKTVSHLESIKISGKPGTTSGSSGSNADEVAPQVAAFDEFRQQFVQPFLDTMTTLGGQLEKAKVLVNDGFQETRVMIEKASKSKKPASDEALVPHLTPISKIMDALENLRMDSRQSPFYNHLYALSEGMKCLAWVSVPNTTVSYVKEMINAAQFYTNKVLVDFRKTEQGETHMKFVEQFKQVINELANYIKEHHMTGLRFNPQGGDLSGATVSQTSAPQQAAQQPQKQEAPKQQTQQARPPIDLLASISAKKDSAATGLKTVTDDMKTKNRTDKVSVVSDAPKAATRASNANAKFQGTAKFELEKGVGEKWVVEYQQNKQDLVISETNLKQNVYIYRCLDTVIQIQGKVKGIVVDGCKKVAIVADSVVSSIEFVNCESCKLQINGEAHTVSVDKTDGFQLFLSKNSLTTKLISSKSSEMNINVPSKTDEDDMTEHPVPEQYVTAYDDKSGSFSTAVNSVFM